MKRSILILVCLALLSTTVSAWWNEDWSYRQKLTLDTSSLSGDVTNDHPILVKVTSSNTGFWDNVKAAGEDVRFIAEDDNTELKYHIEDFDHTSDDMFSWVKVTDTFESSSNIHIYMYYGNSTATDNQDSSGTYPADYNYVWHLNDAATSATGNSNTMTLENGLGYAAGKLANSLDFDGTNDSSYLANTIENGNHSYLMWIKTENTPNDVILYGGGTAGNNKIMQLGIGTPTDWNGADHKFCVYENDHTDAWGSVCSTTTVNDNQYHHLVAVRTGTLTSSDWKIYVDGVLERTNSTGEFPPVWATTRVGVAYNGSSFPFEGIVDEVKVYEGTLSDNEVKLLFKSEDNSLITFGAQEPNQGSAGSDLNYWLTFTSDSGTTSADMNGDTLTVTGGTGIDTSIVGDVLTLIFDATEILTTTWGNGSLFTWTFDASAGTDTSMAFGDNSIDITSETLTTSGNLNLTGNNKELRFYEASNYVGFESPALSADQIWVLPDSDGSSGQVLSTDGSGNLSWSDSSSGGVTKIFGGYGIDVNANTGDVNITANTNEVFTTVAVTNRTGSTVSKGDVVVIDSDNDNSVEFATTTVSNSRRRVLGVVRIGGPNLTTIYVQTTGRATVNVSGSVNAADFVVSTNDNDGKARRDNSPGRLKLGRALTSGTDTTVDIVIQT